MAARALYGNEDVCAYVTNKKNPNQLRMLRFFGLKVALYGGLAQQEPHDPKGIMSRLRRVAATDEKICYLGQYDNDRVGGPPCRSLPLELTRSELAIARTLDGSADLEANPKGQCFLYDHWNRRYSFQQGKSLLHTDGRGLGCITGTGLYLKSRNSSVKVVGVCNVFGDPTPGPRHFPGFESSKFPWRETIDDFEEVPSIEAYNISMQLCREGIIAGPSSGEALCGLIKYLEKRKNSGTFSELSDKGTGEISCVFICCDLPYQYLDGYFDKLKEDQFPPIINEVLNQASTSKSQKTDM
ncbi:MAG: hypothetical protein Q9181_003384 [Wetmoreana brouardii]